MRRPLFLRVFCLSVATVLLAAAGAKLLSSLTDARIGGELDPLFQVSNRLVWRLGSSFDLALLVSLIMLERHRAPLIAWAGALFISYHAFSVLANVGPACPCLGNAAAWLGLTHAQVNGFSAGFAGYMLVGGLLLWLKESRAESQQAVNPGMGAGVPA